MYCSILQKLFIILPIFHHITITVGQTFTSTTFIGLLYNLENPENHVMALAVSNGQLTTCKSTGGVLVDVLYLNFHGYFYRSVCCTKHHLDIGHSPLKPLRLFIQEAEEA